MKFELVAKGHNILRLHLDGIVTLVDGTPDQWRAVLLAIASDDYTPHVYASLVCARAPSRGWYARVIRPGIAGSAVAYLTSTLAREMVKQLLRVVADAELTQRILSTLPKEDTP